MFVVIMEILKMYTSMLEVNLMWKNINLLVSMSLAQQNLLRI